jgi:hypothetical protein
MKTTASRGGLYTGWVGHQNLGDEAIWEQCRKQFPEISWRVSPRDLSVRRFLRDVYLRHSRVKAVFGYAKNWLAGPKPRVGLLGGGTLINRTDGWLNAYDFLRRRLPGPVPVFGTGVSSPELWSSQPWWTDRRGEWVERLNELPAIGVRGPLAKGLLEEAGARNVLVCGDPSVLFHQPLEPARESQSEDRPLRIGINCGRTDIPFWGDASSVEQSLAAVARELVRLGHQVELIAVAPRDVDGCLSVAAQAGLDAASVPPVLSSASHFLNKVRALDLLVSFRLHAAVLAAAATVPVVILEYRPKCLDFAASIGWERFTLRTSELTADRLLELTSNMLQNLPSIRAELCKAMCQLRDRCDRYCRVIERIWRREGCGELVEVFRL